MHISNATKDTMSALRLSGYKWTIQTEVDHRIELHNEIEFLDGRKQILFVAELDNYGNVTEWGEVENAHRPDTGVVLNADGDVV